MRVSFLRGCEFDSRQQRVVLKFFEWMTAGPCSIHFFYAVYQNFCRVYTPNKFLPTVERNDLLPQLRPGTIYADVNHLSVLSVFSTRTPFRKYLQLKIIIRRIFLRKNRSSFEIRPSHLFSALGIIPKKGVADFVQSSLLSHRPAKIPSLFYAREARRATNSKDVAGVPLMR